MDLVLIELVLWIGLLFFFWALKEGLGHVESDIESLRMLPNARHSFNRSGQTQFARPERVAEMIGTYHDAHIYRYAVIQGRVYQFDRVCPPESEMALGEEECWVAPGLVYQASQLQRLPAEQNG